jgi:pilus assembly protein CpaE
MDGNIALVGNDPKLVALLRATGEKVTVTEVEELARLGGAFSVAPDILMIDSREQPFPPVVLSGFKRHHPTTPVVMLVKRLEAGPLLDAMRSGVSECLADPITQPDLELALGRMRGLQTKAADGKIFAFVGAKGGVGTTTTAVNVAAALAQVAPGEVLLIDLHLGYGDAAVLLGVQPRFSVLDALENVDRLDDAMLSGLIVKIGGLDLLAAAERSGQTIGAHQSRSLLSLVNRRYAYTVLDVPRNDRTMLDALDAATTIVIVGNQELATVRNAVRLSSALAQRYGKQRVLNIITREDGQAEISRDDIEQALSERIRYVLPSDYRATVAALNTGRPLVLDQRNHLARALKLLATDLAGVTPPVERGSMGIFSRLSLRS